MRVDPDNLTDRLSKGLATTAYTVGGDEPLLIEECADAIRAAMREAGYERTVHTVDRHFRWLALDEDIRNLSLFSTRRLIELRLHMARPGDAGARFIDGFMRHAPVDTVLLVVLGRIDRALRNTKWFKALDSGGVLIQVKPVTPAQFGGWLRKRLKNRGLEVDPPGIALLARCLEGNLLAAAQEVDKLAVAYPAGKLAAAQVAAGLADDARYDAYALVDACLEGDAPRAARVLDTLRMEGVEPVWIIATLARELRTLANVVRELERGGSPDQALRKHRVWSTRAPQVRAALGRGALGVPATLRYVARLDRIAKGRAAGNIWFALERAVLGWCGVRAC